MRNKIHELIKQAMRNKDQVRLAALRYLWSEIKNAEIDTKVELDDKAIEAIVVREVKKRKEAMEQMKGRASEEMMTEEEAKLKVIEEFMPEMMSREEVEKTVDEVIKGGASDFGVVMGQVMGRCKGKAGGKMVQEIVKEKLG